MDETQAHRVTLARLESDQAKADALSEKRRVAIAAIRDLIAVADQAPEQAPTSVATAWTGTARVPSGLRMKDAALWAFRMAGRPLRVREIFNLLQGAGWGYTRDYEQFRGSMTPTLERQKRDFVKLEAGLYFLADAAETTEALRSEERQGLLADI